MAADATALFEAIDGGDEGRVLGLVSDAPALAGARDAAGVSAVLRARYRAERGMVDAILAAHPELDVFDAAALADLDRLGGLLTADPALARARSGDGFTALHLASYFGGADAARRLLEGGADPNAVAGNPMRVTPLHSAVSARREDVIVLLLEAGADPNVRQQAGWTPLHGAAHNGHLSVVDRLLDAGADPSAASDDGRTPLDMAEEAGHPDVAGRLWERRSGSGPGSRAR